MEYLSVPLYPDCLHDRVLSGPAQGITKASVGILTGSPLAILCHVCHLFSAGWLGAAE